VRVVSLCILHSFLVNAMWKKDLLLTRRVISFCFEEYRDERKWTKGNHKRKTKRRGDSTCSSLHVSLFFEVFHENTSFFFWFPFQEEGQLMYLSMDITRGQIERPVTPIAWVYCHSPCNSPSGRKKKLHELVSLRVALQPVDYSSLFNTFTKCLEVLFL
jgi:hypothetical protein